MVMIKKNKILKESIEYKKYCDICKTEIKIEMACLKAKCEYCGKDLCENCIAYEFDTHGDYREVLCNKCNKIRLQFEPKIIKLEKQIEELENERYRIANSN